MPRVYKRRVWATRLNQYALAFAGVAVKVNVEEAVALVIAVGPAELVLQAPHKVAAVDTAFDGLRIQRRWSSTYAMRSNRPLMPSTSWSLVTHAVFGYASRLY